MDENEKKNLLVFIIFCNLGVNVIYKKIDTSSRKTVGAKIQNPIDIY